MNTEVRNNIIKALEIANENGIIEGYDFLESIYPRVWEGSEEWKAMAKAYYASCQALGIIDY